MDTQGNIYQGLSQKQITARNLIPIKRTLTAREKETRKIDPDSPCGCGSHRKFKNCCYGAKPGKYDSTQDTKQHIYQVRNRIRQVRSRLRQRASDHDRSKLETPEKEAFDEFTPKLKMLTYGSQEYKDCLAAMKPALAHHYKLNSHHPEHHKDGVAGMSLLDLVEMFCDWKAATERHADGDLAKSIEINAERFKLDPQLVQILKNTKREMGW